MRPVIQRSCFCLLIALLIGCGGNTEIKDNGDNQSAQQTDNTNTKKPKNEESRKSDDSNPSDTVAQVEFDASYISEDFAAALVLHPNRFFGSDLVKNLPEDFTREMRYSFGGPEQDVASVEQIVFLVAPVPRQPLMIFMGFDRFADPVNHQDSNISWNDSVKPVLDSYAVIVRFVDEESANRLTARMKEHGIEFEHNGKKYLKSRYEHDPTALHFADAKTLVIGGEERVKRILEMTGKANSPLISHLSNASMDNDAVAVAFIEPVRELLSSFSQPIAENDEGPLGKLAKQLPALTTLKIVADASTSDLLSVQFEMDGQDASDELKETLANGLKLIDKLAPTVLRQMVEEGFDGIVAHAASRLLEGIDVTQNENNVAIAIAQPKDFASTITKTIEMERVAFEKARQEWEIENQQNEALQAIEDFGGRSSFEFGDKVSLDDDLHIKSVMPHLAKLLTVDLRLGNDVTNDGLKRIGELNNFKKFQLSIGGSQITPEGLTHLRGIENFTVLSGSQFSDSWAKEIQELKHVQNLALSLAEVSGDDLQGLAALKVKEISLSLTQPEDEHFVALETVKSLKSLTVRGSVSELALQHIGRISSLERLVVDGVTDESVESLGQLSQLKELNLVKSAVGDRIFDVCAKLENLESLNLQHATITATGLRNYKSASPHVKVAVNPIAVYGLSELQSSGLQVSASLNERGELATLSIRTRLRPIAKHGDATLKVINGLPGLESLDVSSDQHVKSCGVDDAWIEKLSGFENLKALKLAHCYEVTDVGLKRLEQFKNLESLDIEFTGVTKQGLEAFKEANPQIEVAADEKSLRLATILAMPGVQVRRDEYSKITSLDLNGAPATDEDLAVLKSFDSIESLNLRGTKVTDAGLKQIFAEDNFLPALNLSHTKITDEGLKALPDVRHLDLSHTQVTDTGLKVLGEQQDFESDLERLSLANTQVTDQGLKELARLHELSSLDLTSTQVEVAQVSRTQQPLRNEGAFEAGW